MVFLDFINIPVFFASFFIGLFLIHLSNNDKEKISVYPTPDNCGKIEYVDRSGNCFEFEAIEVTCSKSLDKIKEIPVQA
jgi:hypothetical protein